ncbi:MAG: hypothetical protein ACI4BI_03540 [Anaerotardibacter sp.]
MAKTFKKPDGSRILFSSLPYKAQKILKEDAKNYALSQNFKKMVKDIPEEVKAQYLKEKKIQKTYEQFSQVTDKVILDHINSLYLLYENDEINLIAYVDSSLIAAELNARRELIKFKYREKFDIQIDNFDIRISRGSYLQNYPFRDLEARKANGAPGAVGADGAAGEPAVAGVDSTHPQSEYSELSAEDLLSIEEMVSHVEDEDLRNSFKKVLIAQKKQKKNFL